MTALPDNLADTGELHSPDWYRVAGLQLALRPGVGVSRQVVRGQVWHVLADPYTGRQHRFNDAAWSLIGALDGERTLDAIWRELLARHGDDAPTQPEAIRIVAHAYGGQLLLGQLTPDARVVVKVQRRNRGRQRRAAANPFAFRLPLWNPDAFLARALPAVAWLFGRPARLAGWTLALLGLLLLALNGGAVARDTAALAGSPRLLLAMWLAWPLMKALHELAHAFTIKQLGGEVTELGVTLMLLTPVPYVDATASSSFADKRERAAVAAAGILVEAVIASLALVAWLLLEPGLLREACLAVVLVGGVSTLLVNGNPLMRFDGYHVFTDLLELPNLGTRSARWWQLLLQRRLLGQRRARLHDLSRGEEPWLIGYAPLSWLWRVALLGSLALAATAVSQLLALLLLGLAAWTAAVGPAWKVLRWTWQAPEAAGLRVRTGLAGGAALAAVGVALFTVPVADRTHAPGIVWLPDEAFVRLHGEARVERFLVADGATVEPGMPVAELRNEELVAALARARQALREAGIERLQRLETDAGRAAAVEDRLRQLHTEAERLQEQVDRLTLRAGIGGRIVIREPQRVLGRWMEQGETVAQVLPPGAPRVRVLVRNEDVVRVRDRPGDVAVQLAHAAGTPLPAVVERAVPRASRELPSAALGHAAGGPLPTDPSDTSGRTATQARFAFDLRLAEGVDARVGARALVTFEHGRTVSAVLLVRLVRELFLRHFAR